MGPALLPPQIVRKIDRFVDRLDDRVRLIATEYVQINDVRNCEREIIALFWRYGNALSYVSNRIEKLRTTLDLPFEALRTELRRRLYH